LSHTGRREHASSFPRFRVSALHIMVAGMGPWLTSTRHQQDEIVMTAPRRPNTSGVCSRNRNNWAQQGTCRAPPPHRAVHWSPSGLSPSRSRPTSDDGHRSHAAADMDPSIHHASHTLNTGLEPWFREGCSLHRHPAVLRHGSFSQCLGLASATNC
jgi:hypothetical protein